jgi:micrococcal nuclease
MLIALHFSRILLRQSRTAALTSLDQYKRTVADVLLPDGMNLNQELVKRGWCWWYRKYAPGEMVLERLGKEMREARKGL